MSSLINLLRAQVLRSPCDVLIGKGGHEVIAVVIVWLEAKVDALVVASCLCSYDKVLGKKLFLLVEVVSGALNAFSKESSPSNIWCTYHIDEDFQWPLPFLNQFSGIMLFPLLLLILTKVSIESFLTPRAVDGIGDRRKGRDRLVFARVLEELRIIISIIEKYEGKRQTKVKAPWPPMLWPVMLTLLESSSLNDAKSASGSSLVI